MGTPVMVRRSCRQCARITEFGLRRQRHRKPGQLQDRAVFAHLCEQNHRNRDPASGRSSATASSGPSPTQGLAVIATTRSTFHMKTAPARRSRTSSMAWRQARSCSSDGPACGRGGAARRGDDQREASTRSRRKFGRTHFRRPRRHGGEGLVACLDRPSERGRYRARPCRRPARWCGVLSPSASIISRKPSRRRRALLPEPSNRLSRRQFLHRCDPACSSPHDRVAGYRFTRDACSTLIVTAPHDEGGQGDRPR